MSSLNDLLLKGALAANRGCGTELVGLRGLLDVRDAFSSSHQRYIWIERTIQLVGTRSQKRFAQMPPPAEGAARVYNQLLALVLPVCVMISNRTSLYLGVTFENSSNHSG